MKKYLTLLLTFALCMSLTVPAFAAFPATAEEAVKSIELSTSVEYEGLINESFTLYDEDVFTGELEPLEEWNQRGSVRTDSTITVKNAGDTDNYLQIKVAVYPLSADGKYVLYWGQEKKIWHWGRMAVTSSGLQEVEPTEEFYASLRNIKAGESYTLSVKDALALAGNCKNAILEVEVDLYNDASPQYYWQRNFFEVNNELTDAFVAAVKENPPTSGNPFSDVPANAYYHDAVLWALKNGITTGTSETTFGPTETCTRGQVATFLWRAKGCPEPVTTKNPFTDVKENDYFYKAVLWALENGITNGTSATTFGPGETCTSGQVITFLWRANGKPAAETTGTEYYAQAAAWANANGLLAGTDVAFAPNNLSPRADIVTYLYRDMAK